MSDMHRQNDVCEDMAAQKKDMVELCWAGILYIYIKLFSYIKQKYSSPAELHCALIVMVCSHIHLSLSVHV